MKNIIAIVNFDMFQIMEEVVQKAIEYYVAKHGDKLRVPNKYFEEQSQYSISFKEDNKNE